MYNTKLIALIFIVLVLPVSSIAYAHPGLADAKLDYSIAVGEYALAYGKWETAERVLGIKEVSLEVTVSEWNSNLEDIGENVIDAIGWQVTDIANAIKQGAKTVGDLFDMKSLALVRSEKQAEIDNIRITIPQLITDRDAAETTYWAAKAKYQSLQHLCSGCNNLIDHLWKEGHKSLLCGNNHTYYECNSHDKRLHTASYNCNECRTSPLQCEVEQHRSGPCMSCGGEFYACNWGTCYFGPHPQTSSVTTCLYPSCLGGYNLSSNQQPYPPHHH